MLRQSSRKLRHNRNFIILFPSMDSSLIAAAWVDFFSLLKKRWKSYAWFFISLLAVILSLAALAFGALLVVSGFTFGAFAALEIIAFWLLMCFLNFAVLRTLHDENGDSTLGAFFKRGANRYWKTLGSGIALGLLLAAVVVVAILILMGLAYGAGMITASIAGIILGLVAVYFLVRFSFVPYRIVLEDEGPLVGLSGSMKLVQGRWWKCLGTHLFMQWNLIGATYLGVILIFFFALLLALPFGLFSTIMRAGYGLASDTSLQSLIGGSVNYTLSLLGIAAYSLIIFFASLLSTFGSLALYRAFKAQK